MNDRSEGMMTLVVSPASSASPHARRTTVGIAEAIAVGVSPTDRWNALAAAALLAALSAGTLAALAFHYLKF